MKVLRNVDDLVAELEKCLTQGHVVISVDGTDGSGKTRLATALSSALGAENIELDRLLERNKGGFLDYLDYGELQQKIRNASVSSRRTVVEGVCVQKVLNKINVKPDVRVYVKRLIGSDWTDGKPFEQNKTADQIIAEEEDKLNLFRGLQGSAGSFVSGGIPGVKKEVIRYHCEYGPHKAADYIFEFVE